MSGLIDESKAWISDPASSAQVLRNVDLDNFVHKIVDDSTSAITYEGRTFKHGAAKSEAVWQIRRISIVGSETTTEFADDGKFTQIWDDRVSLFDGLDFSATKSVDLDGVNDFLNGGDVHKFDIATAFSIGIWVKPQNIADTRIIFSKAGAAPDVKGWMLRHNATSGALFYQMRGGNNRSFTSSASVAANTWQLVGFSYDGSNNISGAIVYLNGVSGGTPPSGSIGGTMLEGQDYIVGSRNGAFYFSGRFFQHTVWNKALNASEWLELYNSGVPIDPNNHSANANLISYNPLGENDTFPTLSDDIGSADLTMTNMDAGDIVSDAP